MKIHKSNIYFEIVKSAAFLISVLLKKTRMSVTFSYQINENRFHHHFFNFFLQEKADTHQILQGSEQNSHKRCSLLQLKMHET